MDNASKNAGEMINSLQLQYNRGRQASITNELVDIITGRQCLHHFHELALNDYPQVRVRSELHRRSKWVGHGHVSSSLCHIAEPCTTFANIEHASES